MNIQYEWELESERSNARLLRQALVEERAKHDETRKQVCRLVGELHWIEKREELMDARESAHEFLIEEINRLKEKVKFLESRVTDQREESNLRNRLGDANYRIGKLIGAGDEMAYDCNDERLVQNWKRVVNEEEEP